MSPGLDSIAVGFQRSRLHAAQPPMGTRVFDIERIRADFPILHQQVHGKPLVWLDNAATTQKPRCVIDAISRFYMQDNSNIHRGAHTLAARATDAWENARSSVQRFLGADSPSEIIFLRGTTEAINLVAQTVGRCFLRPGDEIVLTVLEHHANIVPWQMAAKETGAVIKVAPVNDRGEILLDAYEALLGPKTKLVALTHASNSLGTILPVEQMTAAAKRQGALVLIDGAQTVSHMPINVQAIGCDFFVFSGHKIFAPTGIGALYARREIQNVMPPWQGGGNMIRTVTFEETTYSDPPAKFEAGTPSVADAVGLHAAIDYVTDLGWPAITQHEHHLLEYGTARLQEIPELRLIGQARQKVGVLSFVMSGKTPEQIGKLLDQAGIAVLCWPPLCSAIAATLRAGSHSQTIPRHLQHHRRHRPPRRRAASNSLRVRLQVDADSTDGASPPRGLHQLLNHIPITHRHRASIDLMVGELAGVITQSMEDCGVDIGWANRTVFGGGTDPVTFTDHLSRRGVLRRQVRLRHIGASDRGRLRR
jgi:cysteine desulfurase/selenocysteine lyase